MDEFTSIIRRQLSALKPRFRTKKPHFNFIMTHYCYIIGGVFVGSIILFVSSEHEIEYIDSLFLAAAANTQAGLSTVDLNKLNTFQQVWIYLMAMSSNTIAINSFVVLLRLYWFEKRFQHIVRESRARRGTISEHRAADMASISAAERGHVKKVKTEDIRIIGPDSMTRIGNDGKPLKIRNPQPEATPAQMTAQPNPSDKTASSNGEDGPSETNTEPTPAPTPPTTLTNSRPAVQAAESRKPAERMMRRASTSSSRAIIQRLTHTDCEVLRIPNRQDAELGIAPSRVNSKTPPELDDPPPAAPTVSRPHAITIKEPDRGRASVASSDDLADDARAIWMVFSFLSFSLKRKKKVSRASSLFASVPTRERLRSAFSRDKTEGTPYLSFEPTVGRNSAFPNMTDEQREELGGIEYRSLRMLAFILTCYFWGISIIGVLIFVPWILRDNTFGSIVGAAGQSRTWWGFFTSNSAFTDLGYTLTPDSMNSFNKAPLPLIVMAILIILGNTGFPVFLRFLIWVLSLLVPVGSGLYEELKFLLDHPRRCFTLLFPSAATWWLFWLLILLNGLDILLFIVLDLNTGPIESLPAGFKFLDGFFQAASTRTAGFTVVNLALLHPAVQVSYMIMMYISIFPIAISVRRTNVYEEDSLGIYKDFLIEANEPSAMSYVGAHLRRQLSFDLWFLFIGFFILTITEGGSLISGSFNLFALLFETVSAYGTVGLSLGHPTVNSSLSTKFSVLGKLVVIAMMIRGRHRGLPYALDRAILLPGRDVLLRDQRAPSIVPDPESRTIHRYNSAMSAATTGYRPSPDCARPSIFTQILVPGPAPPPRPQPDTDFHHLKRSVTGLDRDARRRSTWSFQQDLSPLQKSATSH